MSDRHLGAPRPRLTPMRAFYEELRIERRKPEARPDSLDDLRALIHILAMAMTDGKAVR